LEVEGHTIAKVEAGTIDCQIDEGQKGIVRLYELLTAFREVEKEMSSSPSFVYAQVSRDIPMATVAALRRTLDAVGYPYYLREGIWGQGHPAVRTAG
jgi:hypothetical protein